MRVLICVTLLFMIPLAAGAPANGTQPTADDNVLFAHVDEDSGQLWFSNAMDEPNRWDGGWGFGASAGVVGAEPAIRFQIPMGPAPTEDILLDTSGAIEFQVALFRYDAGASYWHAQTTLYVDGGVLAHGVVSYTGTTNIGPGSGAGVFRWEVAPGADVIPAGAEVVWVIEVGGASSEFYLNMYQGATRMEWPVIDPDPIPEETGEGSDASQNVTAANTTDDSDEQTEAEPAEDEKQGDSGDGSDEQTQDRDVAAAEDEPTPAQLGPERANAESSGIPGPGIALLVAALALIAWVRRR